MNNISIKHGSYGDRLYFKDFIESEIDVSKFSNFTVFIRSLSLLLRIERVYLRL